MQSLESTWTITAFTRSYVMLTKRNAHGIDSLARVTRNDAA
jgi:hypothetical protein